MSEVVAFIAGAIVGIVGFIVLSLWYVSRPSNKEKVAKMREDMKKPASPNSIADASVNARLKQVRELTEQQLALQQGSSGPQKNALDGKYKNGLNAEIRRLEEEKATILQSILNDGLDPEITTLDDNGEVEHLKLSEFMMRMGFDGKPAKPAPPSKAERMGKFTVYKGGKDDDGGETTH